MTDRRFNEDEVAAIFRQASEAQQRTGQPALPTGQGPTLAELQDIGREVGIAPELVARAAVSLGQSSRPTSKQFLGLPIGVGQIVDLERKLSDSEWEQLVVDLRETFDARGRLKEEGSFRQWTNGNLQVLLEPTPTGERIRFRTFKSDARGLMVGGLFVLGFAVVSSIRLMQSGDVRVNLAAMMGTGLIGAAVFAAGAIRLPGWARTRRRQMLEIAGRLTHAMTTVPAPNSRD